MSGAGQRPTRCCPREYTVIPDDGPVDDDVLDADGRMAWRLPCRSIAHCARIEHHDVRLVAGVQLAAIGQSHHPRRATRHLPDAFLESQRPALTHVDSEI